MDTHCALLCLLLSPSTVLLGSIPVAAGVRAARPPRRSDAASCGGACFLYLLLYCWALGFPVFSDGKRRCRAGLHAGVCAPCLSVSGPHTWAWSRWAPQALWEDPQTAGSGRPFSIPSGRAGVSILPSPCHQLSVCLITSLPGCGKQVSLCLHLRLCSWQSVCLLCIILFSRWHLEGVDLRGFRRSA